MPTTPISKYIQLPNLPISIRENGIAVSYNGNLYLLAGFELYMWTGSQWSDIGQMPNTAQSASAVVYDGKIYLLGGFYSPTNFYAWDGSSWTTIHNAPYGMQSGSAVVYDNKIHILGGVNNVTKHYSWDGTNWTEESTLPYNFKYGSAVVYNNKIHILGGSDSSSTYTKHYSWNGSAWVQESTLPYNFYYSVAVVKENSIHILGGASPNSQKHYSWNGTSWTQEIDLPYTFIYGTATVHDGVLYFMGGGLLAANEKKFYFTHYFANLGINKVVYGNSELIDLTYDDLASSDQLLDGVIAHDRSGAPIMGTYVPPTTTETTLWTNPNPTSGLAATTVTLSDDINNYDYLKIIYKHIPSATAMGEDIISVPKFISYGSDLSNASPKWAIGKTGTASDDKYIRYVTYDSDTTIEFKTGQKVGSGTTSTNACVPISIIGVKNPTVTKYANMKSVTLKGSVTNEPVSTDFTPTMAFWYRNDGLIPFTMLGVAIKGQGGQSVRLNGTPALAQTDVVSVTFGQNGITYTNPSAYATSYPHTMVIIGE